MDYWEKERSMKKRTFYRLLVGLPTGLLFGLPILLTVIFKDWYKNMSFISGSQVIVIIIAVLIISIFFALFKMYFSYEKNEQFYRELKYKESLPPDVKDA